VTDWLDESDSEPEGLYAGEIRGGLSWLARGGEPQDDGSIEFIASTGSIDRYGDSIDQGTWRLKSWRDNPVLLADHAPPVIGRGAAKVVTADDGTKQLRIRAWFDESDVNPVGRLIAHQHRNGFRRGMSVGFLPGEVTNRKDLPEGHPLRVSDPDVSRWMAGYLFRFPELLESSSVAVPANREALQLSLLASRAEDRDGAVSRWLRESTTKAVTDQVLAAIRTNPEVRRAVQALAFSAPSTGRKATTTTGGDDLAHLWSK
jgi:hypothetical protein